MLNDQIKHQNFLHFDAEGVTSRAELIVTRIANN